MPKGTPKKRPMDYAVKDATKDLVLKITNRDIDTSKRKANDACAAAHALCRQGGFKEARVYKTTTYVKHANGTWTRFTTPKDLYMEIMIFDRGGKMEAGEYKLTAPKGSLRLGHHMKPTGKLRQTGRMPATPHIVGNVRDNAPKGRNHLAALFA
jgi:hypothetical protein